MKGKNVKRGSVCGLVLMGDLHAGATIPPRPCSPHAPPSAMAYRHKDRINKLPSVASRSCSRCSRATSDKI